MDHCVEPPGFNPRPRSRPTTRCWRSTLRQKSGSQGCGCCGCSRWCEGDAWGEENGSLYMEVYWVICFFYVIIWIIYVIFLCDFICNIMWSSFDELYWVTCFCVNINTGGLWYFAIAWKGFTMWMSFHECKYMCVCVCVKHLNRCKTSTCFAGKLSNSSTRSPQFSLRFLLSSHLFVHLISIYRRGAISCL